MQDELNDNLNEIAPKLASIPKKELFVVPEGYFDEVLNKVMDAKNLYAIDPKEKHLVPDGYFDELGNKVMLKIRNHNKKSAIFSLRQPFMRWSVAAAVVIAFGTIAYTYLSPKNLSSSVLSDVEFTLNEYTDFLMDEVTQEELVAYLSEENIKESEESEDLIDYLMDTEEDFELENY